MNDVLEVICWKCMAGPGVRCRTAGGRVTDTHSVRWETRYPPPGSHNCKSHDPNCWRCHIAADELDTDPRRTDAATTNGAHDA